ncbi:MAG: diaminopimelate decarboxylase, partial [Muribaculaceae bacterium]|nr:diaminopimelate decarboxylase [Muribaculaceae bacterium]
MQKFPIDKFEERRTPFYYYDMDLLRRTVAQAKADAGDVRIHYAVKANANPAILKEMARAGLGADCVSGGEIALALESGFAAGDIMFAGVGKTDREILLALDKGIGCLNV